jgi:hypothetical protein
MAKAPVLKIQTGAKEEKHQHEYRKNTSIVRSNHNTHLTKPGLTLSNTPGMAAKICMKDKMILIWPKIPLPVSALLRLGARRKMTRSKRKTATANPIIDRNALRKLAPPGHSVHVVPCFT